MSDTVKTLIDELSRAAGASCVGCGYCCRRAPCGAALRVFGPVTECPALVYEEGEGRYYCDLCRKPGDIGERYREELSVGAGCCSPLFNTDRDNIPPPPPPKPKKIPVERQFRAFLHQIGCMGPLGINGDLLWLLVDRTEKELGLGESWKNEVFRILKEERPREAEEFMGELLSSRTSRE